MFDPQDVKEILEDYADNQWDEPSVGAFVNFTGDQRGKTYEVPGLGLVTIVDYHDYDPQKSYDGWAEDTWIVFKVNNVFYRVTGTYTSYYGSEWRGMSIVQPVQKLVTFYEEV